MEDIDSIIRLDPMEQVQYEKEQNLYSIIKTVEYLVSHHLYIRSAALALLRFQPCANTPPL